MKRSTRFLALGLALTAGVSQMPSAANAADPLTYETIFAPDKLVEVSITIDGKDWDALRAETRSMADAMAKDRHPDSAESPYDYYKADVVIDGVEIKNVGLRKKGFIGSLDRERPSLKVHFGKFEKGREVAGLEKLTLNNNKQDPSAMNQVLAYKTFRDAGLVAPRANHAHVTVNGKDLDIYSNVESVDDEFVKRHFKGKPGTLYEGTVTDFVEGWQDKFETKLGKKGDYSDIEAVIKAAAADDENLIAELGKVIDLEQFYRFWAVEVLVQHWDGYTGDRNNYFVHRPKNSAQFTFIPWGADSIGAKHPFWQFTPPKSVYAASVLSRRLYDHPESRKQYRQTLREILETVWNTKEKLGEIDRIEKLIGEHMAGKRGFESAVGRLKEFVAGRHEAIMAELNAEAPDWKWPLGAPAYIKTTGTISGNFSTKWGTLLGSPFAVTNVVVDMNVGGKTLEFKLIGASAGKSQQAENKGDPSIRIAGRSEGGRKMTMINFGIQPQAFKTGEIDIDMTQVFGMAMEIDPTNGGFKFLGLLQGTINLDEASTEKGEPVSGSFEVDLLTFSGTE